MKTSRLLSITSVIVCGVACAFSTPNIASALPRGLYDDTAVAHYVRAIEITQTVTESEFSLIYLYARSESVQSDPMLTSLLMRVFPARNEIVRGASRSVLDSDLVQLGPISVRYSHPAYNPLGVGSRVLTVLAAHARWSAENDDLAGAIGSIASGYRYVGQLAAEGRYFESSAARNEIITWMRLVERLFESGIGSHAMARAALDEITKLNESDPAGRLAADRPGVVNHIAGLQRAYEEGGTAALERLVASAASRRDLQFEVFNQRAVRAALDDLIDFYDEYLSIAAEACDELAAERAAAFKAKLNGSIAAVCLPQLLDPLALRLERTQLAGRLSDHRESLEQIVRGDVQLESLVNGATLYLRCGAMWRSIPEEIRETLSGMEDLSDAAIVAISNEDVVKHVLAIERLLDVAAECQVLDFYAIYHGAGGEHVRPVNREILAALDAMAFVERRLLDRAERLDGGSAIATKVRGYATLIRNAEHIGHENSWIASVLASRRCAEVLDRVESVVRSNDLNVDSRSLLMIALSEVRNAEDPFGFDFSKDRDRRELELVWSFLNGMHRDTEWRETIRAKISEFTPWQTLVVRVLIAANASANPNFDHVRDLDRRLGTELAAVLDEQWSILRVQTGRAIVEPEDVDEAFGWQEPLVDLDSLDMRIDSLQQALVKK